jgi:CheW-like domain
MLPRPARPAPPRRRMYIAFAAGGHCWALPAEAAAGVGELGPVTRLPTAESRLLGLFVHQGRIVALLAAPGNGNGSQAAAAAGAPGHFLLLRAGGGTAALAVDELIGLRPAADGGVPEGLALLEDPLGGAAEPRPETSGGTS